MEKIKFSDLNLKVEDEIKEFDFNGQKIQISQYLSCADKYQLLDITLKESYEDGIYNAFKIDLFFHLNLILGYCINLEYSDEDLEQPYILFDKLKSSGLLDAVISCIDEDEYNLLKESLEILIKDRTVRENTVAGILNSLSNNIPEMLEEVQKITKDFNPEQFKNIIDFAKIANLNRDIQTNQPSEE